MTSRSSAASESGDVARRTPPEPPVVSRSPDMATVIGLFGAFALITWALAMGGSMSAFVDVPSLLITVGGTIAVTMASFSLKEFFTTFRVIGQSFFVAHYRMADSAIFCLKLAEMARNDGLLALERILPKMNDDKYLKNGLRMVVDGTPVNEVERTLTQELSSMRARHAKSVAVLRRAAELAPAMGLIGTLIGLVQMLGNLSDPTTIGPSMAVALITTFYGAIMANMLFLPLASKLERNSEEEVVVNRLFIIGVGSIGRRENPRRMEVMINAALPPSQRIKYFD